jgi:hypothetical protein
VFSSDKFCIDVFSIPLPNFMLVFLQWPGLFMGFIDFILSFYGFFVFLLFTTVVLWLSYRARI